MEAVQIAVGYEW